MLTWHEMWHSNRRVPPGARLYARTPTAPRSRGDASGPAKRACSVTSPRAGRSLCSRAVRSPIWKLSTICVSRVASPLTQLADAALQLVLEPRQALTGLAAATLGLIVERGIIQWIYDRPLETLLATWGVGIILEVTGLAEFMDGFAGSEDVARGKPAPDVFLLAEQLEDRGVGEVGPEDAALRSLDRACVRVRRPHGGEMVRRGRVDRARAQEATLVVPRALVQRGHVDPRDVGQLA